MVHTECMFLHYSTIDGLMVLWTYIAHMQIVQQANFDVQMDSASQQTCNVMVIQIVEMEVMKSAAVSILCFDKQG